MNKIIEQLETYYFDDVHLERFFKSKRHQDYEDLKYYILDNLNYVMERDRVFSKAWSSGNYLSFAYSILNLLEDDDWKKLYSNLAKRKAHIEEVEAWINGG
tara:strand:- start:131 stop:433 length:303 start_codon:yes stop_codon:yes gene_type:complete